MKYQGSKRRIAKDILPIILKDRRPDQVYVEPFCGGCNLIDKVPQGIGRIASDIHTPLISLLKALQEGWLPPEVITEEDYKQARLLEDSNPLKGYLGFQLSFGASWFTAFRRDKVGKRNYATEAFNNVKKQAPSLAGITFYNNSYLELDIPSNSLIYCDPPYKGTTGYKANKTPFNHEEFYDWCLTKYKEGHTIFVSEYWMPEDFICVWEKTQVVNLDNTRPAKHTIEKLFTLP